MNKNIKPYIIKMFGYTLDKYTQKYLKLLNNKLKSKIKDLADTPQEIVDARLGKKILNDTLDTIEIGLNKNDSMLNDVNVLDKNIRGLQEDLLIVNRGVNDFNKREFKHTNTIINVPNTNKGFIDDVVIKGNTSLIDKQFKGVGGSAFKLTVSNINDPTAWNYKHYEQDIYVLKEVDKVFIKDVLYLHSIGAIHDEISKIKNIYTLTRRLNCISCPLTGWYLEDNTFKLKLDDYKPQGAFLCDKLLTDNYHIEGNIFCIDMSGSLEDFLTYLRGLDLHILYQLRYPKLIQLPYSLELPTFDEETFFKYEGEHSNICDITFNVKTNLNAYIDALQDKLQLAEDLTNQLMMKGLTIALQQLNKRGESDEL